MKPARIQDSVHSIQYSELRIQDNGKLSLAKTIVTVVLAFIILSTLHSPLITWAAQQPTDRPIYIGDIIKLEIAAGDYLPEYIRECFGDFEIVELTEVSGGYQLALRAIAPGEYHALVGDKEIVITVASTLDDITREDIFPGGSQVMAAGLYIPWPLVLYSLLGILMLFGVFLLIKLLRQRKTKLPPPYQVFLKRATALPLEQDNYFVDLTLYFKEYIESLYHCRIKGKTSAEIIDKLHELPPLAGLLAEAEKWLKECDRLKFTGLEVSTEQKQQHYTWLLELVKRIDADTYNRQKEGDS
ncbi:MAG: hypothetical protein FWG43_00560 [Clostridiales bacterium]|nr:hypothetical protein [Clostridiales bacterium]